MITEALDKLLRIKIRDNNFEWRFDDSLVHHFHSASGYKIKGQLIPKVDQTFIV